MLALINKRLSQWELELKEKKIKSELSLQSHKNKLSEITMSYVENKISKDIFELSTQTINEAIHKTHWDLLLMEDYNKTITYLELTKQFLYNISEFRTAIDDYEWTKNNFNGEKSSPHFWVLFSTVANCIVDAQSISNYELFEEFGILNYIPSGYVAEDIDEMADKVYEIIIDKLCIFFKEYFRYNFNRLSLDKWYEFHWYRWKG